MMNARAPKPRPIPDPSPDLDSDPAQQPPPSPSTVAPPPPNGADDATRKRVADALIGALDDSNQRVREQALETLAAMHDDRAIPALTKAMNDPSPAIRRRAIAGLQEFERVSAAFDALVKALADNSAEVREGAATALGRLRNSRAVASLVPLIRDANVNVRRRAAWALGNIGDAAAIDALTAALKDADPAEQAAQSLGWIARGRRTAFQFTPPDFDFSQFANQEIARDFERQRDELDRLREQLRDMQFWPSPPAAPAPPAPAR